MEKNPKVRTYTVVACFKVKATSVEEAMKVVENYRDDPYAIKGVRAMAAAIPVPGVDK